MNNSQDKGSAVILFGSPNKNGFTAKLTNELISQLKVYYAISVVDSYNLNINPCISCNYCISHDSCFMPDFQNIDSLLKNADLIIVASPVYNLGFPAPLKALFDRMQPYFNARFKRNTPVFFKKKTGILLLTCGAEKSKCEDIIVTQINMIFSILKTKLKFVVTMDKTDFSPNINNSLTQVRLICSNLKQVKNKN